MSDRLREALEWWEAHPEIDAITAEFHWFNSIPIVAAARRFLALTETGQQILWCEVHRHEGFDSEHEPGWVCESGVWLEDEGRWDCRMIPVYLIPADYLTEEE